MGIDFIIFLIVVACAIVACILGDGKIHKVYFGIIIGFLLFLVFNTKIELLELATPKNLSSFQVFLMENKEFILSVSILGIPIFGILFLINTTMIINVRNNILLSILFGGFLPLFLLLLLSYVEENSYVSFDFLKDILGFFENSSIFTLFRENTSWAIFGLLFLLFYRAGFLLMYAFVIWLYTIFRNEFFGEPEEKKNQEEE